MLYVWWGADLFSFPTKTQLIHMYSLGHNWPVNRSSAVMKIKPKSGIDYKHKHLLACLLEKAWAKWKQSEKAVLSYVLNKFEVHTFVGFYNCSRWCQLKWKMCINDFLKLNTNRLTWMFNIFHAYFLMFFLNVTNNYKKKIYTLVWIQVYH